MKVNNDHKRSLYDMTVWVTGIIILVISMWMLSSCTTNEDRNPQVSFYLTDAPTLHGYKAVYVDIQEISYNVVGVGWRQLPLAPGVYNLMKLTNGNDTLLSKVVLNDGEYIEQVRLKLGSNNSLMLADSSIVALDTPSGMTSGIKINIHDSAVVYSSYSVVIDFNAEKSIVRKGNSGGYLLKPVINGFIRENTSMLSGNLLPAKIPFKVSSILGTDTMTCLSDTSRNNLFVLQGLYSGTWKVEFRSEAGSLLKAVNVDIVGGFNKNLGVINLSE